MKSLYYKHGESVLLIRKGLYDVLIGEKQNSRQWNNLSFVVVKLCTCVYVRYRYVNAERKDWSNSYDA